MPRPRSIELLPTNALIEMEGHWRAGLLTIKVIAAKYRVDADALRNFAVRAGWVRNDLSEAILAESTKAFVESTVASDQQSRGDAWPSVSSEQEVVRRYGQLAADVIGSHRDDAARGRLHASRLERELARIYDLLAAVEDPKERMAIVRSAAETLRCIAGTTKTFIDIERQAWQLDKDKGENSATYDDFLAELYGEKQPRLVNDPP